MTQIFNKDDIKKINDNLRFGMRYGNDNNYLFNTDNWKYSYQLQKYNNLYKYQIACNPISDKVIVEKYRKDQEIIDRLKGIKTIEDFPKVKEFYNEGGTGWKIMESIPYELLDLVVINICKNNPKLTREVMNLSSDGNFVVCDKLNQNSDLYYIYKKEDGTHYKYSKGTWVEYNWTNPNDKEKYLAHLDYKTLISKIGCNSIQYNPIRTMTYIVCHDDYITHIDVDIIVDRFKNTINSDISTKYINSSQAIYHKDIYYENRNLLSKFENPHVINPTNFSGYKIQTAYLSNFTQTNRYTDNYLSVVLTSNGKTGIGKTQYILAKLDSNYNDMSSIQAPRELSTASRNSFNKVKENVISFTVHVKKFVYNQTNMNILFAEDNSDNNRNFDLSLRYSSVNSNYVVQNLGNIITGKTVVDLGVLINDDLYMNSLKDSLKPGDSNFYNIIKRYNINIFNNNDKINTIHNNYQLQMDNSVGIIFKKYNMYDYLLQNNSGTELRNNGNVLNDDDGINANTNVEMLGLGNYSPTNVVPINFSNTDTIFSKNNDYVLKKYDDRIILYINVFQSNLYNWLYDQESSYSENSMVTPYKNYCFSNYSNMKLEDIPDKSCTCFFNDKILDKLFSVKDDSDQKTRLLGVAECISDDCVNYRNNSRTGLFINEMLDSCSNVNICKTVIDAAGDITLENNQINQCLGRTDEDITKCVDVDCNNGFTCRFGKCVQRCTSSINCDKKENQEGNCVNGVCQYTSIAPDVPDEPEPTPEPTPPEPTPEPTKDMISIFGLKIKKTQFSILIVIFVLIIVLILVLMRKKQK